MFVDYWKPQQVTFCGLQMEPLVEGTSGYGSGPLLLKIVHSSTLFKARIISSVLKSPSKGREK